MKNPFTPGNGIVPLYLAGRDEELKLFEDSLDEALILPRNMVVSGLRGTGKTVLLMEFEKICARKNWLFVRREFNPGHCQKEEFVSAVLTDMATKVNDASIARGVLRPKIGFLNEERERIINSHSVYELLSQYMGPLGDRLEGVVKDVYSTFREAGFEGLVLLYDEFHQVEDGKRKDNYPLSMLLEAFGHVQQAKMRYYLVLSGLPSLFPNLVAAKTYAERMFMVRNLQNLSSDKTRDAFIKSLNQATVTFSSDLIERLIKETAGYPYFIQFFGYFLVRNIPKLEITEADFEGIKDLLLQELDESFFKGRFSRASNGEKEVLLAMAHVGELAKPVEIKGHLKISKGDLNLKLANLVEKRLLYKPSRGVYAFSLPLFKEFLLRKEKYSLV